MPLSAPTSSARRSRRRLAAVGLGLALAGSPLAAETARPIVDPVQDLALEDPEGWAMATFAAVSLPTSLGPVEPAERGRFDLGLELIQAPHLDQEQRRIGFGGFKEEDLNRSPAWGRLRLGLGLPAGLRLVVGWVPPVAIDGVEANLLSVALERRLGARGPWSLAARLYAQRGEVDGDFTCTAGGDHLFPPGSAENPFGCEEPSRDTVRLDYAGAQLVGGYRPTPAAVLHLGLAWTRLDSEFRVRAETFGFSDRSLLRAAGDLVAWTAGVSRELDGARGVLAVEALYAPLEVDRLQQEREDDPLIHLRLGWRLRLR